MWTKEALAARKNSMTPGRPKDPSEKLKLRVKRDKVEKYLMMGLAIRPMAKLIDEAPRVDP